MCDGEYSPTDAGGTGGETQIFAVDDAESTLSSWDLVIVDDSELAAKLGAKASAL